MTHSDLCNALEHLAFEIHHFQCYSALYNNSKLARVCPAAKQAVQYSLLLHMRILLEFFFVDPIKDDVSITHCAGVIDSKTILKWRAQWKKEEVDELRLHLNKKLAHFSKERWTGRKKSMDFYMQYAGRLDQQIASFVDALPSDMRERYDRGLGQWARNVAEVRS